MNEQKDRLTLQETEQLCEFFMDCRLSVFQENELRYILSQIDYHSPLIDDVRRVMGIELLTFDKSAPQSPQINKRGWRKKTTFLSVAASIAIIACLGAGILLYTTSGHDDSAPEYIAYVDGHQLSEDAARLKIEAELIEADAFIKEMSELEAKQQQIIDNFFYP